MGKDHIPCDERPAVEITPEMIEAGAERLLCFSRERDLEEEAVREIFLEMWRARPSISPSSS